MPRLALTPSLPSCLQLGSAGITGVHHYCLIFERYIYYTKNSRSILFSLKFLQFISHLHDRAKVPPSSCLIWSHLWFRLKLVPAPPFSTPTTKSPVGKCLTLLKKLRVEMPQLTGFFLASAKLLLCFSPATANPDVIFLCSLLKAVL